MSKRVIRGGFDPTALLTQGPLGIFLFVLICILIIILASGGVTLPMA